MLDTDTLFKKSIVMLDTDRFYQKYVDTFVILLPLQGNN